ncbi:uncharacterized protein LOC127249155 [Andrographis paniculata]|uniref:uncharacterized protein LOC127249155 n=1 Tax=Andrographis paniculata TaxID=175694 RepID=UPI0021E6F5CD|nr:uncharacterized protein LOC127249155 [Andrographis paniculata]
MGFFSFLGRLLFASVFILSAWQMFNEFGSDGGPAAKQWAPKLAVFKKYIDGKIGKNNFHIDAKAFVGACIFLKGLGGILFVFGSNFGAHLLIYYLILTTPFLHDFYNYKAGEPKFLKLLNGFVECLALLGALLYFLGMKSSISRRQPRKKAPKSKTA